MKVLKFVLMLTLAAFVGGIVALAISKKIPKMIAETISQVMTKMCEKMKTNGKFPMDCCKKMMKEQE